MADTENTTGAAPKGATATRRKATEDAQPTRQEKLDASLEAHRDAFSSKPANIGAADADGISASGAIMEPEVKGAVPVDHPAVDNNPRAGTTVRQNQVDFNDPDKSDAEAVADNLSK